MNRYPFQYAVLRYVHDVITEEFLNIGVIVYSKPERFLKCLISERYGRLSTTFNGIERLNYSRIVSVIRQKVERLGIQLAQVSLFDTHQDRIEDFLHQVVMPNDASLVLGGYGGGLVEDLDLELERLYKRLVEQYIDIEEPESRNDQQVWAVYARSLVQYNVLEQLAPVTIQAPTYGHHFDHAYKNEKWHPIEPVSLDLVHSRSILEKANRWIGNATVLADSDAIGTLYLLLGAPRNRDLYEAYEYAVHNLETKITAMDVRVVKEENADQFSEELNQLIREHSSG